MRRFQVSSHGVWCFQLVSKSPSLVTFLRLSNNLAGQYKRGIGMALHIGIGNFGGAIASNIYRSQDSPRFILGRTSLNSRCCCCIYLLMPTSDALELMFVGIGLICVPIAVVAYVNINNKRDKKMQEALERGEKLSPEEIRRLGDRAPDFRYVL
jgi:hypothetical protein